MKNNLEKDIKKFAKKYPRSIILYDANSNTSQEPFSGIEMIGIFQFYKQEAVFKLHNIVKEEKQNV
jgi:hypothetical protein